MTKTADQRINKEMKKMQRKEIEQKIEDGEKILEMAHEKIEVWKSIRDKVEDGQKVLYEALKNCT